MHTRTDIVRFDIFFTDSRRFDHIHTRLSDEKSVVFKVDASNGVVLGFFTSARNLDEMYEIVISGWNNKTSVIRCSHHAASMASANTTGLLCGGRYTQLWADARGGLVRLGRGDVVGHNVIVEWQDPDPLDVQSLGLKNGDWPGTAGKWLIKSPDPSRQSVLGWILLNTPQLTELSLGGKCAR